MDEIGNMSLTMQVKLYRVLQEGKVRPVGSTDESDVDVRIIAATNKEFEKEIAEGRFREDLYYRLSVIPIHVPPLRERREDIPLLARYFLERFRRTMEKNLTIGRETFANSKTRWSAPSRWRLEGKSRREFSPIGSSAIRKDPGLADRAGNLANFLPKELILKRKLLRRNADTCRPHSKGQVVCERARPNS